MSKRFLSLVLASLFSFMIPLKVSAADELIKKINIKIPGTDVVLTMSNLLPEYVVYEDHYGIPVHRFAFPGNTGKVTADRPSIAHGQVYFEAGGISGEILRLSGDLEYAAICYEEKNLLNILVDIDKDGNIIRESSYKDRENHLIVATVELRMGYPIEKYEGSKDPLLFDERSNNNYLADYEKHPISGLETSTPAASTDTPYSWAAVQAAITNTLIKKIDVKVPGTDVVLTMENVLPEYAYHEVSVYDSDKPIPVYRFSLPYGTGKVSADRPSTTCGYYYVRDGGLSPGWSVTGDLVYKSICEDYKDLIILVMEIDKYGNIVNTFDMDNAELKEHPIVAYVEYVMGYPSTFYKAPDDLLMFEDKRDNNFTADYERRPISDFNSSPATEAPKATEVPKATEAPKATEEPASTDAPSSWAAEQVSLAIQSGLVPDTLQKNYAKPVSRGDVSKIFISLIEKSSKMSIDDFMALKKVSINEDAFTDTKDKDVLAANALGIIAGVEPNLFKPDSTLTRAQIAAIINRIASVLGVETSGFSHSFTDVTGHWVDKELGWPVKNEVISGIGDNKFDPDSDLTTEQAIAITYRALLKL